jgi:hypothetical protein
VRRLAAGCFPTIREALRGHHVIVVTTS